MKPKKKAVETEAVLRDRFIESAIERKGSHLHIRASSSDLVAFREAAKRKGWTVSEWATYFLRMAAAYDALHAIRHPSIPAKARR